VVYSATKYIGGHSAVIAGAVLSHKEPMLRVRTLRTFLGNMAGPWTGWLLLRSLETLKLRMEQQRSNAQEVALFLNKHAKVESVNYLGLLEEGTQQHKLYKKQCSAREAMVTFKIKGKEKEAFKFLNALSLMKLAVSLGSTESLDQHPASMTHAGGLTDERLKMGITENLVRLSIGIEKADDLISDIGDALKGV
jgi:methionine-gamma-lyase